MQFDSVEELGRQLDLPGDPQAPQQVARENWADTQREEYKPGGSVPSGEPDVSQWQLPPVPFTELLRNQAYMTGWLEADNRVMLPGPPGAPSDAEWMTAVPDGPCQKRFFVPLAGSEPDPHEKRHPEYKTNRRMPMTGAHLTLLPQWRRKPPYRTLPSGEAEIHMSDDTSVDSISWKRCFASDARLGYVRSHIHKCQETCWKHSGGGAPGDVVRICRFDFHHEYAAVLYKRRIRMETCVEEKKAHTLALRRR